MTLRRNWLIVAVILLGCTGVIRAPSEAHAVEAFTVGSFDTAIEVHRDSSLSVTETITVDFGANQRHGIFRTIPKKYAGRLGSTRTIKLRDVSVTDGTGGSRPFTTSGLNTLTIKIGDSDTLISGQQTYVIHYDVLGALNYFQDHDELYWNATGTEWDTQITAASSTVRLPQDTSPLQAAAYQGSAGSQEAAQATAAQPFQFASTRALSTGEGLTIVASWPKGITAPPTQWDKFLWFVQDNWPLALPIAFFLWLVPFLIRQGRDPHGRGTIVPEFAPSRELSLLEQAALRDERIQSRDLTALIISWAADDYITIHEPKRKHYELTKKKVLTDRPAAERTFFKKIFEDADEKGGVSLNEIKAGKLATAAAVLRRKTFQSLVSKQLVVKNPETVRSLYLVGGFALLGLGVWAWTAFGLIWGVAFAGTGVILSIAAPFMPRRTKAGVLAKEQLEGFELYLRTAERYQMEFAEKERLFERYLPYAIAFGVATIWAKAFGDIAKQAPSWYSGYYASHWSVVNFSNSLNSGMTHALTAAVTTASSGRSGFAGGGVGGGFGGGGGGSW